MSVLNNETLKDMPVENILAGVYVGSFNPLHEGHIATIKAALKEVEVVFVVPTDDYWDKKIETSLTDRYENVKKVINEDDYLKTRVVVINYAELKDNLDGSTYDILELVNYFGDVKLIVGADTITTLDKWKHIEDLLQYYEILVMPRNNIDIEPYMSSLKDKYKVKGYKLMDAEQVNISSTEIREKK